MVSVYPAAFTGRVWIPSDSQEEALEALKGNGWEVNEVASCGAQSYHVIVDFESFDSALKGFDVATAEVLATINRLARSAARKGGAQ